MQPTIESAKKYIDSIDFSALIDKLVHYYGWRRSDALLTCDQYRKFLFLHLKYPDQPLPPSEDIDEIWHNHILDTKNYARDCEAIFGKYLHHNPYLDETFRSTKLLKAFETMKELYFKEFCQEVVATKSQYPALIYFLIIQCQKLQDFYQFRCKPLFSMTRIQNALFKSTEQSS